MVKVLVHGNPETAAVWDLLLPELAAAGVDDVVTVSPPGFGAPLPDGFAATPAAYVEWLAESVKRFDGPVDLVGHDWGAGHVLGLVALGDEAVQIRSWAVDVIGIVHPDYVWHDMAQLWRTPGAGEEAVAGMAATSDADKTAMFEELGLPSQMAAQIAPWVDDAMGQAVLALYRAANPADLEALGKVLQSSDLPPGLVINALDDAYVSPELSASVAQSVGARVAPLEGQGHWWMATAPAEAAAVLAEFWASFD